jgi:hypothetical protein
MPITFKSKHSPNVVMLETVALSLIKAMGHSGSVPGSLAAEDIAPALARLQQAVTANSAARAPRDETREDDEREPAVSLKHRAGPLIDMFEKALREHEYVIWDSK